MGRMPNPSPIRLAKDGDSSKAAEAATAASTNISQYSADQLEFCVKCFRRTPADNELEDDWLKSSVCGM
ncbi:hypothetical protein RB195_023859 [Necator americanus]|uniref:Uncharacterized protein n=1 Tax=Necator americanus TaxID=51031 RepID=A0ABR1EKW9_NECAM